MRNPNGSQKDAPVTVTFPIPRKAASKLRTMAVSRDRRLLDLGVLAVQINEGESIVLGIKLGKQRIKNTVAISEKLRGNARRGRVCKKPSNRNVATIHHMPDVCSSKFAPNLEFSSESNEKARKRATQLDREIRKDNSGNNSSITLDKSSNNICKFRKVVHFRAPYASGLSLNGESSAAKLSDHQNNKPQKNSSNTLGTTIIRQGSNVQQTTEKPSSSPANIASKNASVESYLPVAQSLSSPGTLRAYSASPSSDTSSTSSEENFDIHHDQLIYNCFVDKSKYSAANMLKELAASHSSKNSNNGPPVEKKVLRAVKTSNGTGKATAAKKLSQPSTVGQDDDGKSKISGSYRDHVKNIRCNSIVSLMTCTSTVNSTLKIPATNHEQTRALNSRSIIEKPATMENGIASEPTQPSSHCITLSKASTGTASQTKSMKINTSKTTVYRGGRKVLWSSANALPRCSTSSAHFADTFLHLDSPSDKHVSPLSHLQENVAIVKSSATTCSSAIKSTAIGSFLNKPLDEGGNTPQSSSRSVVVTTGSSSLSSHSQELHQVQNTSTCATTVSTRSTCNPGVTDFVQTEGSSTSTVQNLTMASPAGTPATVVVAGTNTQTTWSSQQVSPTYFVGAQGQYGIYSTLYSPDCNNNQLGQQSVAAAYVYPVSFIYPYLAMAQANSQKSLQSEAGEKQKANLEVTKSDTSTDICQVTNVESTKESAGTTANLESMPSTSVQAQTQFIDLASSVRYWQQLSLLYRSRIQALASCNLSTIHTICTSSVSTTTTASTDAIKSTGSSVMFSGSKTSVNSNSGELPFKISEANSSLGSYPDTMHTGDFSKQNPNPELLQHKKPEMNLEENFLKEAITSDRQSVIVSASGEESWDHAKKTQQTPRKLCCQQEISDSGATYCETVLCEASSHSSSFHLDRPRHIDGDDDVAKGSMPPRLNSNSYGSPPKLSFIHDSSIACVNVGNSNGFGGSSGSYAGARKPATQLDAAGRPAKRRKSKKSL